MTLIHKSLENHDPKTAKLIPIHSATLSKFIQLAQ